MNVKFLSNTAIFLVFVATVLAITAVSTPTWVKSTTPTSRSQFGFWVLKSCTTTCTFTDIEDCTLRGGAELFSGTDCDYWSGALGFSVLTAIFYGLAMIGTIAAHFFSSPESPKTYSHLVTVCALIATACGVLNTALFSRLFRETMKDAFPNAKLSHSFALEVAAWALGGIATLFNFLVNRAPAAQSNQQVVA